MNFTIKLRNGSCHFSNLSIPIKFTLTNITKKKKHYCHLWKWQIFPFVNIFFWWRRQRFIDKFSFNHMFNIERREKEFFWTNDKYYFLFLGTFFFFKLGEKNTCSLFFFVWKYVIIKEYFHFCFINGIKVLGLFFIHWNWENFDDLINVW